MGRTTEIDALIGRNLRVLRAAHSLKQADVAERMARLGHSQWVYQTVGQVERGERAVLVSEARDLAIVFATTLPKLLSKEILIGG